jgi:transposase
MNNPSTGRDSVHPDDHEQRVVLPRSACRAAENFRLSPSSAVRWWRRWHDTGTTKAKLSGGSKSPLEEHAEWLLALVAEQPDSTLDEIVTAMRKRRIPGSRTAVWRFFERHNLTFKKALHAAVARARRRWRKAQLMVSA